jgi:hypothetical protein
MPNASVNDKIRIGTIRRRIFVGGRRFMPIGAGIPFA